MIQRVCKQCGKSYDTFPSIKPVYCSHACASKSKERGANKTCRQCGKTYWSPPSRSAQEFCSKSCARTSANLTTKNPAYARNVSGEKNPMFGRGLIGEANPMHGKRGALCPRWKGGRRQRPDGYVRVVAPNDHPYPSERTASGLAYILEHRLVMEKHIGRFLQPCEVVHHRDENPRNNAISNLRLYASNAEHLHDAHGST